MKIKMIDILTGPCGMPNTRETRSQAGMISKMCSERFSKGHPGIGDDGLANWRDEDVPELVKIIEGILQERSQPRYIPVRRGGKIQSQTRCEKCTSFHNGEC